MRNLFCHTIFVVAAVCISACSSLPFGRSSSEAKLKPFLGEPSIELQQVFKNQRFPNIVVAMDGTLVATWGSDGVVARRSGIDEDIIDVPVLQESRDVAPVGDDSMPSQAGDVESDMPATSDMPAAVE